MPFVYSNNKLIPEHQFSISHKNRAFRYGDGVFETLKVRKGVPLFLKHHYSRLILALDTFQFDIPEHWTYSFFVHTCLDVAKQNEIENGNLRIQVSRLGEGKYLSSSNGCDLLIEIHPIETSAYQLNEDDFHIDVFKKMIKPTGKASQIKSVNSQVYVQAAIYKQQQNLNDVIILNEHGRIADASASNVFIVVNNLLITPPSEEGGIDGVMRRVLIKLCKQNKIELQIAPLTLTDLGSAEEIFLTNVMQGIRQVTNYNNKSLSHVYAQKLHPIVLKKEEKEIETLWEFI